MNKEAILRVAKAIEDHADQFDMNFWTTQGDPLHNCKSAACVGGWTDAVFGVGRNPNEYEAAVQLGLTEAEADELFYPNEEDSKHNVWDFVMKGDSPYKATAKQAVKLLRAIVSGAAEFKGPQFD